MSPKPKYQTLTGFAPEVEAAALVLVSQDLHAAIRTAVGRLHHEMNIPVGASLVLVARTSLTTLASAFFAVASGDQRLGVEDMLKTVLDLACRDTRHAVRQVDNRDEDPAALALRLASEQKIATKPSN